MKRFEPYKEGTLWFVLDHEEQCNFKLNSWTVMFYNRWQAGRFARMLNRRVEHDN